MRRFLVVLAVLIFLPSIVSAATIQGTVYDMSLQKASAVVSIDTTPKQQSVTLDGGYSFEVSAGSYTLSAATVSGDHKAEESIVVEAEGTYNLDLILFPTFEEESQLISEAEELTFPDDEVLVDYSLLILAGIIVIIIVLAFIGLKVRKLKPVRQKPLPADLDRAIRFIRKNGGRVNQKDMRNEFNLSEAKISLMVAEMESMGLVKRIRKGRGNVLVLQ